SHAAGQGPRTTLRLPTRQFPSRRRCGREAACVGGVFPERCVMKPTFAVCAALLGLQALSPSAIAEQKTARQCNDDWSANKAAIQASGKTKRVFMAECRGMPLATPVSVAAPVEKGQYASEGELPERCRGVGQFHIQNLPPQRQPKLRQDPERRVYVREGLARGRFPRAQAREGRCDLTSAPASEYSSVVTVPSRHRHRSSD